MPITIETPEEWEARQGSRVYTQGIYIYESGARLSSDGVMKWDPSEDERERLKLKADYWEAKVSNLVKEYNAYRSDIQQRLDLAANYKNLPCPNDVEIDSLGRLAKQIEEMKDKAQEAKDRVAPTQSQQFQAERSAEHATRIADAKSALASIPRI